MARTGGEAGDVKDLYIWNLGRVVILDTIGS
jgi:hypothetical protein